ncbi:MAG: hypothetical protein LBH54_05450 [Clostridiales bacterium]|jgi:hypothetical protein|nr:hypothetical protein [Clostridiales bacterium]
MKKAVKILQIILAVLLAAGGVFAFRQRGNIASLITSAKLDNMQIAERINGKKSETERMIKQYAGDSIRDFTHEEEEQIRRGEVTPAELIAEILGESPFKEKLNFTPDAVNSVASSVSAREPTPDLSTVVNAHIAGLYVLKAHYIGKLGELERRALGDYKALPKENRGTAGRQQLLSAYLGEAAALERECDGEVERTLDSLRSDLRGADGGTELIKTIRKAYEEEKILKKSYYLNSYEEMMKR